MDCPYGTIFYGSYFVLLAFVFFIFKFWKKHRKIAVLLLIFFLVFAYSRFIEPNLIIIKSFPIEAESIPNNESFKIAVASDFHIGTYSNKILLARTVAKINAINPDLVIFPGDFIWQISGNDISNGLSPLKSLISPAFAVLGNHDTGFPGIDESEEITAALNNSGIIVLNNEIATTSINNNSISLIGLSELRAGKVNFSLQQKADGNYKILISHNPDAVSQVQEGSADLLISGHTHGGQVKIPLLYKKFIPTRGDFIEGLYNFNKIETFVTSGIGTVGLPLRFFTIPEIDILEIK